MPAPAAARVVPALALTLGLSLVVGVLGASCSGDDEGPGGPSDAGPECVTRDDCEAGEVCGTDGVCQGCESSGQCRLKEACNPETLRCELRESWGTECVLNAECSAGKWCRQGLCLNRDQVALCPGGSSDECPARERCNLANGVCEEDLGCAEDADCSAGELCNTGSYACVPRCTVDTAAQVCSAGEKCVAEKCVQCEKDADCSPGLRCDAAGRCSTEGRCYNDRDCKVPLVCYEPTGACVTKPPPCISDENCVADERCDVDSGRCVLRACQADRFEPNDGMAQAFGIQASRYNDLTLCEGDVDWYSLAMARGDELGVNVDADPFAENTFTTLIRDGTGRVLAGGKLLVSYVAPAAQTYYVAISTTDPVQPYDVNFLLSRGTPCDDDGFEPNDSVATATALNAASALEGAICPQDADHVRLEVPAGKGVQLTFANYDASKGALELCLLEGAGGETTLGCSDAAAPVVTAQSAAVGGKTVFARVRGLEGRTANSYTLQVVFP